MTTTDNTRPEPAPQAAPLTWYAESPDAVTRRLGVDPLRGLPAAEARRRLEEVGPNALAQAQAAPVWKQFLQHYREYMQVVL